MAYQDPYEEYMSQYQGYEPQKPSAGASYLTSGLSGATGGAAAGTAVLPGWGTAIGAGVGALSSLYGNYVAQGTAEKNYRNQLREFERQKALAEEARKISEADRQLQNQYAAKHSAQDDEDRLLSRYSNYYRGIGL